MKARPQNRVTIEKNFEIRRKVNAQKHRRKQKRKLIIFYIFFIISVFFVSLFFIIHSFFKISQIEITGSKIYSQQQVKKVLDFEINENIFRYRSDVISQKIKNRLVYIDEAKVIKKLPNKIFISLVDAVPKYFIKTEDKYFILSKNMKILEEKVVKIKDKQVETDNLIQILGVTVLDKSVGDFILKDNEIFIELKRVLRENKLKDITKLDISNRSNIKVVYQDRITILLGKLDQLDYKIQFIKKIINKNIDKNERGILDATSAQKNLKVYFRPHKERIEIEKKQNDEEKDIVDKKEEILD